MLEYKKHKLVVTQINEATYHAKITVLHATKGYQCFKIFQFPNIQICKGKQNCIGETRAVQFLFYIVGFKDIFHDSHKLVSNSSYIQVKYFAV